MLEKNSIAGANSSLAGSKDVPRQADAGHRIKDVAGHTALGHAILPALNLPIDDGGIGGVQVQRDCKQNVPRARRLRTHEKSKISVKKNASGYGGVIS